MELSDDSDIEVHPNVDKRSFIRAKQNQIHAERQKRKHHIEALQYERIVNDTLMQRLSALLSSLKAHADETRGRTPADVAFQAVMKLAPRNPEEDNPPPRPEGVFDEAQPLPTYSQMMASILDDVNKKLDNKSMGQDARYRALMEEIGIQLQRIQDLQKQLAKKLDDLEREDAMKITSGSYHTGFDSSHVNKAKPDEKSTETSKLELLNPTYDLNMATVDAATKVSADLPPDSDNISRASSAAKTFARIRPSDYRASHEYISAHPEILQESETDGLLIEAFNAVIERSDGVNVWQYVHQALLLQWCRMLGRDGVAIFFKRISTPGHHAREVFKKDIAEKFQRIGELAAKQLAAEESEAVEHIQIQTVEPGTAIHIRIPEADSEDEEVRKARAIFEEFAPEIKAALESGSLENVNKVLGTMDVVEAEKVVSLLGDVSTVLPVLPADRLLTSRLGQAGCLDIEKEVIDTTTEEGAKQLKEMEEAVVASQMPEPQT